MEAKLQSVEEMQVVGIEIRTSNQNEMNPATAQIPALWGRFQHEQIIDQIPNRAPDGFPLGVYSKYQSEHSGAYSVLAGIEVADLHSVPRGMVRLTIPAGDYLVFSAQGPMPQAVIQAWGVIWRYFSDKPQYVRAYSADFESYRGPEMVDIHIAIR